MIHLNLKYKAVKRGPAEVIPNVYQLPLAGTSAFLLLEEHITVVDAGWRGGGGKVVKGSGSAGHRSHRERRVTHRPG